MITTKQYNDFSGFNWEQKQNIDFMFEEILKFHQAGGDLTLPVKTQSSIDSFSLTTLDKFIKDNISNSVELNQRLIQAGVFPGMCDFSYDKENKKITEKQIYGITWMKNNFDDYEQVILQSLNKLLSELPEDYNDIGELYTYDYSGSLRLTASKKINPLFNIAEQFKNIKIYNLIFNKYPNIKQEWEKIGERSEQPYFLSTIEASYSDVRNPEIGIYFLKNGIGLNYFKNSTNKSQMHDLIKYAAYIGDHDFLNTFLPSINLKEIEENQHEYELSLSKAKDSEAMNILINNGASYKHIIKKNNNQYEVNLIYSRENQNNLLLDFLLNKFSDEAKEVKENPSNFYDLLTYKNFETTKLLVEKYHFPLEKFDMLYIAMKHRYADLSKIENFEWVVKNGADTRKCDKFCKSIVESREDGLKLLRQLNKNGIIVAKSADIIYNIFKSNPTKAFVTYYDKLTEVELEKHTINGHPTWWGANDISNMKWMLSRVKNVSQTNQNGEPFFMYALKEELTTSKYPASALIDTVINKMPKDKKIDISYVDKEGNNILHYLVKTEKYKKDSINTNALNSLQKVSDKNLFDFMMVKNKEGICPLDLILTQEMRNGSWSKLSLLKDLINDNLTHIDINHKIYGSDTLVSDALLEEFSEDKDFSIKLRALILEKNLSNNTEKTTTIRKNKI